MPVFAFSLVIYKGNDAFYVFRSFPLILLGSVWEFGGEGSGGFWRDEIRGKNREIFQKI